eukprot:jgi/Undpi1/7569/HiC_scaffold_23.g10042.m1
MPEENNPDAGQEGRDEAKEAAKKAEEEEPEYEGKIGEGDEPEEEVVEVVEVCSEGGGGRSGEGGSGGGRGSVQRKNALWVAVVMLQGGEEAGVDEPEEEVRWGLWWWRGWVGPGVRVGRLLVVRVRVEVLVEGTRGVSPKRGGGSVVVAVRSGFGSDCDGDDGGVLVLGVLEVDGSVFASVGGSGQAGGGAGGGASAVWRGAAKTGSGGDDEVIAGLKEDLAKSEEQLKDTREKALYLAAEMENVRAIAKRDAEGARLYAVQKFAKQLLDVADNLERAVVSAKEEGGGGGDSSHDVLLQGVEMTSTELEKVFRSQGLEKYGAGGDKFDPHLHDAMFAYPDPEQEPGTVGQVLKSGYKLHGRVIRAAQVGTVKEA